MARHRKGAMRSAAALLILVLLPVPCAAATETRFADDFEGDLSRWTLVGSEDIVLRDSGQADHGRVLEMRPNGAVYALIDDSERWGGVRVEADFLFPDDDDNYLGFIYNFTRSWERTDFGSIYIKGNGSYLRANPWRDGNASRLLYEEYRTPLDGDDAVVIGQWKRLKAEVVGRVCHVYVGNMEQPRMTFDLYEGDTGLVGFKPRIVGLPVWIDNVRVTSIDRLAYQGPPIPDIAYETESLLTDWEYQGPTDRFLPEIERDPRHRDYSWKEFETDRRGAVVTGRVTQFAGGERVAYFRTVVRSGSTRTAVLHVTTTDELGLFVNGVFNGFIYRDGYATTSNDWNAWYDFWKNEDHAGRKTTIDLRPGDNMIVIRAQNGQFASGGFFARIEN